MSKNFRFISSLINKGKVIIFRILGVFHLLCNIYVYISKRMKSPVLRVIFYGINGKRLVYEKSFVSGQMLSAKPIIDSGGAVVAEDVIIYGKPGCSFTDQARSAYGKKARYINVESDRVKLQEMLKLSGGVRKVPVIVEGAKVTIGYGGA